MYRIYRMYRIRTASPQGTQSLRSFEFPADPDAPRPPRSGSAALAAGALIQAALGAVFVVAGLSKVVAPDYTEQFRSFVLGSAGARSGPLASIVRVLVVPYIDVVAQVARYTELIAGGVLVVGALEVARRRFSGPVGAQRGYEPIVALISAGAALVLGGLSLGIYLLQGGRLPSVNADLAFASPVAIELLLVPLAAAIAWLELGRFLVLRSSDPRELSRCAPSSSREAPTTPPRRAASRLIG